MMPDQAPFCLRLCPAHLGSPRRGWRHRVAEGHTLKQACSSVRSGVPPEAAQTGKRSPKQKGDAIMASRVNRAIELLVEDQAIYYVGQHTGHELSFARGRADAGTWADYINIGMEHGAFDMAGLAE